MISGSFKKPLFDKNTFLSSENRSRTFEGRRRGGVFKYALHAIFRERLYRGVVKIEGAGGGAKNAKVTNADLMHNVPQIHFLKI